MLSSSISSQRLVASDIEVAQRSLIAKSEEPIRPGAFNFGPKIYPK